MNCLKSFFKWLAGSSQKKEVTPLDFPEDVPAPVQPEDSLKPSVVDPTVKLTKNFTTLEFTCNNKTEVPSPLLSNLKRLADNLQILRDALDSPVHIKSGYRNPRYNNSIGGQVNSQHIYARAADITVKGYTPKEVADKITELMDAGEMERGQVKLYPTYVHFHVL